MKLTSTPVCFSLVNPDAVNDIAELRAALKANNEYLKMLADSTYQAAGAIEHLMGVLAPIVAAHARGDSGEVTRLMDEYLASGNVEIAPSAKTAH